MSNRLLAIQEISRLACPESDDPAIHQQAAGELVRALRELGCTQQEISDAMSFAIMTTTDSPSNPLTAPIGDPMSNPTEASGTMSRADAIAAILAAYSMVYAFRREQNPELSPEELVSESRAALFALGVTKQEVAVASLAGLTALLNSRPAA